MSRPELLPGTVMTPDTEHPEIIVYLDSGSAATVGIRRSWTVDDLYRIARAVRALAAQREWDEHNG